MNHKDCPAAKMACFNCGIFGYMEKVCQKPKVGDLPTDWQRVQQRKNPIPLQPEGVRNSPEEGMTNSGE